MTRIQHGVDKTHRIQPRYALSEYESRDVGAWVSLSRETLLV